MKKKPPNDDWENNETSGGPLFSIITVCMNSLSELRKTETSVTSQTLKDYEWIVVDGGSVDGTKEYLAKCRSISKYVSEPDLGIFDAMNKGIKLAGGQFCLFLNAGDYLYEDSVLEKISGMLIADIVVGSQYVIPSSETGRAAEIRNYNTKNILNDEFYYHRTLPHQAAFVRRAIFSRLGGYDPAYRIAGDREFFLRVYRSGASFSIVDLCVVAYVLNGVSWKNKKSKMRLNELNRIRRTYFSLWRRCKIRMRNLLIRVE